MKELSTRQAGILIFISTCAMKLLVLPSLIIDLTQNGVWITFLIMFLIDGLFLSLTLYAMKACKDITFEELLTKVCGKILCKIIIFSLAVLFIFKTVMLVRECYEYYNETTYIDFDWLIFMVVLLLFIGLLSCKRIRAIGRGGEIFVYFIILTLILAVIFSLDSVDYMSFLPLANKVFNSIINACFNYAFWFGDFLILFLFFGKVKVEKNFTKVIFICYIFAALIVTLIAFLHFALYGSISGFYKTSVVDITEYIPRVDRSGRFTWLIVVLWPIATLFCIVLYSMLSVCVLQNVFDIKEDNKKYISYIVASVVLAILIIVMFLQINLIYFIKTYFKYFVFLIQYVFSIFIPLIVVNYNKKEKILYDQKSMKNKI